MHLDAHPGHRGDGDELRRTHAKHQGPQECWYFPPQAALEMPGCDERLTGCEQVLDVCSDIMDPGPSGDGEQCSCLTLYATRRSGYTWVDLVHKVAVVCRTPPS